MNKTESEIQGPFDPARFREDGHKLVDILSDYLQTSLTGADMPVLPYKDPDDLAGIFSFDSEGGAHEPFEDYINRIIVNSIHIHHPHYIGHQVTSPLPVTALVQFCTALMKWDRLIWLWNVMSFRGSVSL